VIEHLFSIAGSAAGLPVLRRIGTTTVEVIRMVCEVVGGNTKQYFEHGALVDCYGLNPWNSVMSLLVGYPS